ncbi:MAG: methylated-DNA--[protein]-cysteine S-methyltransferase [Nitriliruptorales bacterium]|nr:methylated-DNA--[protein]-cysteine S-methyltransferase [Nitriliruptorales bacterium]
MTSTQAALDHQRVARAIRFVDGCNGDGPPTVTELAEAVGLSRSQLHRVFRRWAGTTPKRFIQYVTANEARERLRHTTSVLDATNASGLSSSGRLHDLMVTVDGMTPGEVATGGADLDILVGRHVTPVGEVVVAATSRGICHLGFTDDSDREPDEFVRERWPRARVRRDQGATWDAVAPAFGDVDAPIRLHVGGTNLQLKVWEALLTIPPGATTTYGRLAAAVERPDAVRAVASAVGRNPVAYLIPCHRVIRSTGRLGGYAWGLERKRLLLARESLRFHPTG